MGSEMCIRDRILAHAMGAQGVEERGADRVDAELHSLQGSGFAWVEIARCICGDLQSEMQCKCNLLEINQSIKESALVCEILLGRYFTLLDQLLQCSVRLVFRKTGCLGDRGSTTRLTQLL